MQMPKGTRFAVENVSGFGRPWFSAAAFRVMRASTGDHFSRKNVASVRCVHAPGFALSGVGAANRQGVFAFPLLCVRVADSCGATGTFVALRATAFFPSSVRAWW
jgi:hypothetical protein